MKKVIVVLIAFLTVAIVGSAIAVDLNLKVTPKDVVKSGASAAVAGGINKELSKPKYTCTWNKKASSIEGCDLKTVSAYLSGQRMAVEKAGNKAGSYTDYDIYIHTTDNKAYDKVKKQLQGFGVGSWDINKSMDGVSSEQVKFSVVIE